MIDELALAGLNAAMVLVALERGSWAIALYAGIFAAGLAWAVALTVGQSLRTNLAARRAPAPIVSEKAS